MPNAFLRGDVDKELFLSAPPGLDLPPGKCLRLVRALYGLKQAPRLWNKRIHQSLLDHGFSQSKLNPCIYYLVDDSGFLILLLYVDDVLTVTNSESLETKVFSYLHNEFKIRDQGEPFGQKFVGLVIDKTDTGFKLHQAHLISEILSDMRMTDCNSAPTPLVPKLRLEKASAEEEIKHTIVVGPPGDKQDVSYRRIIGMLLYVRNTRPDIAYAIHKLAQHGNSPTSATWTALKRLLRYLKGTLQHGLRYDYGYKSVPGISAYCDSDLAGDPDTRRSTTGYVVMLGDKPVSFFSKQQTVTALSSCEAEYVALCAAGKCIMSWMHLLREIGFKPSPAILRGDNTAALKNTLNEKHSPSLRHLALPFHYTREQVENGNIRLEHVPSSNNVADVFTKAADPSTYERLLPHLLTQ